MSITNERFEAARNIDPTDTTADYQLRTWLRNSLHEDDYIISGYIDADDLSEVITDLLRPYLKFHISEQMPGEPASAITETDDSKMPTIIAVLANGADIFTTDDEGREGILLKLTDDDHYRAHLRGVVMVGPDRWAVYSIERA